MAKQNFRIWVGAVAAMVIFFADLALVEAQEVAACPVSVTDLDQQTEEIACLRNHAAGLEATQELLERALLDMADDLESLSAEVRGPDKDMRPIEAAEFAILRAWGPDGAVRTDICIPTPEPIDGYVQVGAIETTAAPSFIIHRNSSLTFDVDFIKRARSVCSAAQYCGGQHTCSLHGRTAGCYVNSEWMSWHSARPGASLDPEAICR